MSASGEDLERAVSTIIRMEMAGLSITQKQLAERIGITRETLSNYLTGKREMPMSVYFKVAEALGLGPRELMQRAEDRLG